MYLFLLIHPISGIFRPCHISTRKSIKSKLISELNKEVFPSFTKMWNCIITDC